MTKTQKSKHNRKGFTIFELLIIVSIISFIAINTFNGFSLSSTRLKFQTQTTNIKSTLDSIRNQAFQNTNSEILYTTTITPISISATTTDLKTGQTETILTTSITSPIELRGVLIKPINSAWTKTAFEDKSPINLTYNSQTRKCNISTSSTTNILQVHIPVINQEINSSNHLYISRENCLSELLTDPIPL